MRHGNDIQPYMGVSQATIEAFYGLQGPERILDSHETTDPAQKETIRRLLGLSEQW